MYPENILKSLWSKSFQRHSALNLELSNLWISIFIGIFCVIQATTQFFEQLTTVLVLKIKSLREQKYGSKNNLKPFYSFYQSQRSKKAHTSCQGRTLNTSTHCIVVSELPRTSTVKQWVEQHFICIKKRQRKISFCKWTLVPLSHQSPPAALGELNKERYPHTDWQAWYRLSGLVSY